MLVIGVGGLGHQAVQIAAHLGATGMYTSRIVFTLYHGTHCNVPVYACDPKPEARELALKLGAVKAFTPVELEAEVEGGFAADVAMDFVARKSSVLQSFFFYR